MLLTERVPQQSIACHNWLVCWLYTDLDRVALLASGLGDMAISNSIGSNVFDILVGLGLPWTLQTLCIDYGSNVSASLAQPGETSTQIQQSCVREGRENFLCWAVGLFKISVAHKYSHTIFAGALCSLSPNTDTILRVNWPADYSSHHTMEFSVIKVLAAYIKSSSLPSFFHFTDEGEKILWSLYLSLQIHLNSRGLIFSVGLLLASVFFTVSTRPLHLTKLKHIH